MSFLTTLAAAFKGGGATSPVPIGRGFVSPWASAFDPGPRMPTFTYTSAVQDAFLANPVAQRSVRIVAEGVGGAPLACSDASLERLVRGSAGTVPLLEIVASQLVLHGNAYVQIVRDAAGVPVELFPLRPERVTVVAGPDGCGLSPLRYSHRGTVVALAGGRVDFGLSDPARFAGGELRWLDGPLAGLGANILAADGSGFALDRPPEGLDGGTRALLREGCDHTIATCAARFGNAASFQGEPCLPGGTEAEALRGHAVGTLVVLLDDRLTLLEPGAIDPSADRVAAIGNPDAEPVFASVRTPGRSRARWPRCTLRAAFSPMDPSRSNGHGARAGNGAGLTASKRHWSRRSRAMRSGRGRPPHRSGPGPARPRC